MPTSAYLINPPSFKISHMSLPGLHTKHLNPGLSIVLILLLIIAIMAIFTDKVP